MDSRLIDALCRVRIGWSGSPPGDCEDFRAADKLIIDRGEAVRGSFREPTEAERHRAALESIAKNTCCSGCQEAAKVARAALLPSHSTK